MGSQMDAVNVTTSSSMAWPRVVYNTATDVALESWQK